jgi:hypothetical protein
VPVMLQQLEERPGPSGAAARSSGARPADGSVRAFCEPLRRAFQAGGGGPAGQRSRLAAASRSQPSSPPYHSMDGSHTRAGPGTGERATSGTPTPRAAHHQQHNGHRARPAAGQTGDGAATTRSLASSRRASVSDELHQLDDLIVALSESRPERFGPLLGIPSSRSSRSNSPAGRQAAAAAGSRRGGSLMVRGSSDLLAGKTRPGPAKQRSLAAATQTPPYLTPSASNNLLAGADQQPAQPQQPLQYGRHSDWPSRRRKSSSSSGASRYAMASARQSSNELNLGESQAALDELEALRFSAVCGASPKRK